MIRRYWIKVEIQFWREMIALKHPSISMGSGDESDEASDITTSTCLDGLVLVFACCLIFPVAFLFLHSFVGAAVDVVAVTLDRWAGFAEMVERSLQRLQLFLYQMSLGGYGCWRFCCLASALTCASICACTNNLVCVEPSALATGFFRSRWEGGGEHRRLHCLKGLLGFSIGDTFSCFDLLYFFSSW